MPVVEKRKERDDDETSRKKMKKESAPRAPRPPVQRDPLSYKSMSGGSQQNFSVLAKIVKYMKKKHLDGDKEALTLEEILDETNQLDVGNRQRTWLQTEALTNNPKIELVEGGEKYAYKPTYNLKDRKSLIRLLDKTDQRGQGGISLEDVQESLPNADKIIKSLGDNIIIITRPIDKRKVLFYKDKSATFKVDEDFQKLWRSVAVDGIDEAKIEEYLQKQGITSMQDLSGMKKVNAIQKRKASKRPRSFKKHNEHMGDILKEYQDK